jgi:hypothetical protein
MSDRGAARSGARATAPAALAVVLALVAGACALRPLPPLVGGGDSGGSGGDGGAVPVPEPCALAAVRSCALPYPSDEFTVEDPSTGTGRRVELPSELVGAHLLRQLGPGARPEDAFGGADGYASLTPVMFEVDRPVDPVTLPADGGDALAVFDLTTGRRVPLRAEVPAEAARHGAPDTIVVAWPRERFEPGHTYLARLTTAVRPRAGGTLEKPAGLREASPEVTELRDALEALEGDRWDEVVSVTRFTVRSAANATAQLDEMVRIARSQDHPFRNVTTQLPLLFEHTSTVVTGEVRISDFRDADGVARAEHGPTPRWVPFLMTVPERPAGVEGAPVAIYGHGLTVAKETMFAVASANAELGVATIGIDVPNHGQRQAGFDGGYLLELTNPQKLGRLVSMPLQGVVDHVSLLSAVEEHLGQLELRLPDLPGRVGQPAPRLDTTRVLYQGTSMGGVLGATFASVAPELDGAFLQVAGTGISDVIYHSLLWPLFMGVLPVDASTGDAYALMGAATMLLDGADNVNVLPRARDAGTAVFLAYGVGDGVVPNWASDRMIGLLDLPLVGPRIAHLESEPPLTGSDAPPADGRGVAQIWSSAPDDLRSFGAHIAFAEARSALLMQQWVQGRLAATGVVAPTP